MYKGPPLPEDLDLPLPLRIEFLMITTAGNADIKQKSGEVEIFVRPDPWSDYGLGKDAVPSKGTAAPYTAQSVTNFRVGTSAGPQVAKELITRLVKGELEAERLLQQLMASYRIWQAVPPTERLAVLEKAKVGYGLAPGRIIDDRQATYMEWDAQLHRTGRITGLGSSPKVIAAATLGERLELDGFTEMHRLQERARGFKKFLVDATLPYFARDDYVNDIGEMPGLPSEAAMLTDIGAAEGNRTLMICGPGGFGKTRLAHYLCDRVEANLALKIEASADYGRLIGVLREEGFKGHLLLFLDYAENTAEADPLWSASERLAEDCGIRTTLILCCRSSAIGRVERLFSEFDPLRVEIGLPYIGNATSYESWLMDQILGHFGLDGREGLRRLCKELPFLAAFFGFLSREHAEVFAAQLGTDLTAPDFDKWIGNRIRTFEKIDFTAKQRLAEICLALPFHRSEEADIIADAKGIGAQVLDTLQADFWVEPEGDITSAVHDTLADALIAQHVFASGTRQAAKRLSTILATAAGRGYLRRALTVVGRLAGHASFADVDRIALLQDLQAKCAVEVAQNALDILRSPLVDPGQVPAALAACDALFEGVKDNADAHHFLSKVALSLRQKGTDALPQQQAERFNLLLHGASFADDPRVLSSILAYDPVRYRQRALDKILYGRPDFDLSFLLQAFLEYCADPLVIGEKVAAWLDQFDRAMRARYVLRAWFVDPIGAKARLGIPTLRGAGHLRIVSYLEEWCLKHRHQPNAARCIQIFGVLKRDDPKSLQMMANWAGQYPANFAAVHLIRTLIALDHGSMDQLASLALRWLADSHKPTAMPEGCLLIKSLQDKGFAFDTFRDVLLNLIVEEQGAKACRDLCCYWLLWGGDAELVRDRLFSSLDRDSKDENVRFAFETWMKTKSGTADEIRPWMKTWLGENATHPRASYIYHLWFNGGIDGKDIAPFLERWLQANKTDNQFDILLHRYLNMFPADISGFGPARNEALELLAGHDYRQRTVLFKLQFILSAPYIAEPEIWRAAKSFAQNYLELHWKNAPSAFLIVQLLRHPDPEAWMINVAEHWLNDFGLRGRAGFVLRNLLRVTQNSDRLQAQVKAWFKEHPRYPRAADLFLAWTASGGALEILADEMAVWMAAARVDEKLLDLEVVEALFERTHRQPMQA